MFVKNLMISKERLITVSREDSIDKALKSIRDNDYEAIPVVENGKFFGAISKASIYEYLYDNYASKHEDILNNKVADVMEKDIPVIQMLDVIDKVGYLLEKKEVPFVAVSDENNVFKGIVTHHKIFHEFSEIFGFNKGKRLSVLAYDLPGQLSKLSRIIYDNEGDIISFVTINTESVTEVSEIVIRLRTDNLNRIKEKIKEAGFQVM